MHSPLFLVDDPRFDAHAPPGYHPERVERLIAARGALEGIATTRVAARPATLEELSRVHTPRYLEQLHALRDHEAFVDADTYVARNSVDVAMLAGGGAIALTDAVLDTKGAAHGLALLRPPGHHARPDQAMGFCLINNAAAAAAHARSRGVGRVLLVDFDVHHGNGTQEIFYEDPHVLYLSTHQFPFYPGTGSALERGQGDGTGFTVNVPLRAGSGDATYRAAFERVILPISREYNPELVLVSAGFDAAARDPLAHMELSTDAFSFMVSSLRAVADAHAGGKIALFLEGGYDLPSLTSGLSAAVHALAAPPSVDLPTSPKEPDVAFAMKAAAEHWKVLRG